MACKVPCCAKSHMRLVFKLRTGLGALFMATYSGPILVEELLEDLYLQWLVIARTPKSPKAGISKLSSTLSPKPVTLNRKP